MLATVEIESATLYIYTCHPSSSWFSPAASDWLSGARCSCGDLEHVSPMVVRKQATRHTQVEVVVLRVAERNKCADYVHEGCAVLLACRSTIISVQTQQPAPRAPTHGRGVLAKVPLLVAAQKTLWLDLGGGASGQLLVKAHDFLHAQSIR